MWILATILGIVSSQTPLPPMWPDVFWQNFSEVTYYNGIGTHTNTGSYYYNWTMKHLKNHDYGNILGTFIYYRKRTHLCAINY